MWPIGLDTLCPPTYCDSIIRISMPCLCLVCSVLLFNVFSFLASQRLRMTKREREKKREEKRTHPPSIPSIHLPIQFCVYIAECIYVCVLCVQLCMAGLVGAAVQNPVEVNVDVDPMGYFWHFLLRTASTSFYFSLSTNKRRRFLVPFSFSFFSSSSFLFLVFLFLLFFSFFPPLLSPLPFTFHLYHRLHLHPHFPSALFSSFIEQRSSCPPCTALLPFLVSIQSLTHTHWPANHPTNQPTKPS